MAKKIDINKAIYDLVNRDDKLKKDLIGLGFKNLSNPLMLKTMGKKMSIRRGAKMVGIDNVDKKLEDLGYEIINSYDDLEVKNRRNLIKSYVKRLSEGEDLQSVREDFVKISKMFHLLKLWMLRKLFLKGELIGLMFKGFVMFIPHFFMGKRKVKKERI